MADYIIVTVQGVDKIGIVAAVTAKMAQLEVNIEDIKQTLMQGHFVMFMLCNIESSKHPFKEIKDGLTGLGRNSVWKFGFRRKKSLTTCTRCRGVNIATKYRKICKIVVNILAVNLLLFQNSFMKDFFTLTDFKSFF